MYNYLHALRLTEGDLSNSSKQITNYTMESKALGDHLSI